MLGAIIVNVLLQLLQNPGEARVLFYLLLAVGIVAAFRLSVRLAAVTAATAGLGFAVHAIAAGAHRSWAVESQGGFGGWMAHWVVVPGHLANWVAPASYGLLIAVVLGVTQLRGVLRLAALPPTLYLAAFVWENVMLPNPGPTRYIVLGLLLVVLMIARPNGLLGERRVEII